MYYFIYDIYYIYENYYFIYDMSLNAQLPKKTYIILIIMIKQTFILIGTHVNIAVYYDYSFDHLQKSIDA